MDPGLRKVRPTFRCLADLGIALPPLSSDLADLTHALVQKAQALRNAPSERDLEPVLSLRDRSWYKVKVRNLRGAATHIGDLCAAGQYGGAAEAEAYWWLCRAGKRQEDSADDFYKEVKAQAEAAVSAKDRRESQRKTDTTGWLPIERDSRRLQVEIATALAASIRQVVVNLIARSLRDGQTWRGEADKQEIAALVKVREGEAYLALGARGYYDEKIVAIILDAVPGVAADEWMIEPRPIDGIDPAPGQVLFSAILSAPTQQHILNEETDLGEVNNSEP